MTKQALLAACLARTGLLHVFMRLSSGRLPVLAYHRILDDEQDPGALADPGLFSATASGFQRQMACVARHFNVITLSRLLDPAPLPPRPLVVTFDDGYEDNYRIAFPILRRFNLSAVFFVTTDFIDGGEPLWFDQLATLLSQPQLPSRIDVAGRSLLPAALPRRQLVEQVLSHFKALNSEQRHVELGRLRQQLGEPLLQPGAPMTWAQLRHMADNGMEIGSHSRSHSVLANESAESIGEELGHSAARIREQLGRPCPAVAYPVGGASAVNDTVIAAARQSGYQVGCTYLSGINALPPADMLTLKRLHVELDVSQELFMAQLALPSLFGYGRS